MPETRDGKLLAHILFADDNPTTLTLLQKAATLHGWLADAAETPAEILKMINQQCKSRCYDAICLDVNYTDAHAENWPQMTGLTVAKEIRKSYRNVPILFLTGYSEALMREAIRSLKADLLIKPFSHTEVLTKLEQMIREARQKGQLYDGPERRQRQLLIEYKRRASDNVLALPKVLEAAIEEMLAEQKE